VGVATMAVGGDHPTGSGTTDAAVALSLPPQSGTVCTAACGHSLSPQPDKACALGGNNLCSLCMGWDGRHVAVYFLLMATASSHQALSLTTFAVR
jgi:hypothetical protein